MPQLHTTLPRALAVLEEGREQRLHTGAQVYVSQSGDTIVDDAWGESADGVPMSADAIVPWLSCTKPVTAVAFAQRVESGDVAFDTPVQVVIPDFDGGGKESITFRHLLTHTAGLHQVNVAWRASFDDLVETICRADLPEGWVPGQRAAYDTGAGWCILGRAIEVLAARPLGQVLLAGIFDPLGMHDAWFGMPAAVFHSYGDRIAPVFVALRSGDTIPHRELNGEEAVARIRPGGNGRGPMRDLARLMESLLGVNGSRIPRLLGEGVTQDLVTRQRAGLTDETFRTAVDWGLGFIVNTPHAGPGPLPYGFGAHASPDTFGHGGSQSSAILADPEHGLVIVVFMNGMPGEARHTRRIDALLTAVYEDLGLTR